VSRHHGCIHPIDMSLTIYYVGVDMDMVGDDGIYGDRISVDLVSSTVAGRDDGGWEMMAKNIRGESLMWMKMGTA
ncbi:hypothetical protein Tco_1434374, partial [Tanacetum coccineum]